MYLYKIKTKDSGIEGKGVFCLEDIPKDSIVWKFDQNHDKALSQEDYAKLNEEGKREMQKVGYLSPVSKTWIYPPENDPARYTNHSPSTNNLSVIFDMAISPEPYFVANRNISNGEELTNNYLEFDEYIKNTKPDWA